MFAELFIEAISGMLCLALHIENKNLFPKPLSAKEEEKYLNAFAEGDKNARDILIERKVLPTAIIGRQTGFCGVI